MYAIRSYYGPGGIRATAARRRLHARHRAAVHVDVEFPNLGITRENVAIDYIAPKVDAATRTVITSYSIHYTKLYDY